MVMRIVTLSVFYNLYNDNYFAHAHTRYTRPPFSSRPGIEAAVHALCTFCVRVLALDKLHLQLQTLAHFLSRYIVFFKREGP